jgi:Zn-dependent alcohol dehydrogenase
VRAAVVGAVEEPLLIERLDLMAPGAAEGKVRLGASDVCHFNLNVLSVATPKPRPPHELRRPPAAEAAREPAA